MTWLVVASALVLPGELWKSLLLAGWGQSGSCEIIAVPGNQGHYGFRTTTGDFWYLLEGLERGIIQADSHTDALLLTPVSVRLKGD